MKVRQNQIKASLSVNSAMLNFYWSLGCDIVEKQKSYKWGEGLFIQLSKELFDKFPDMKGFSVSNLRYMRQWYLFYSQAGIIHQQAVGELDHRQIGVSEYRLTQSLPETLKSRLPSIEELEAELAGKNISITEKNHV